MVVSGVVMWWVLINKKKKDDLQTDTAFRKSHWRQAMVSFCFSTKLSNVIKAKYFNRVEGIRVIGSKPESQEAAQHIPLQVPTHSDGPREI